jgi:cell division septation protein DedD
MADSSSYRSPRGVPPRRDEPSADPARHAVSDPLTELARLIGQDEAFGAIVRNAPRPEPREEPPRQAEAPPWRARPPQADWGRDDPEPSSTSHVATVDALSRQLRVRHPLDPPPQRAAAQEHDGHEITLQGPAYPHEPDLVATHDDGPAHADESAAPHDVHHGGDHYGEGEEAYYEGEEDYADAAPERRRGGLVIAAAVAGLALMGTAGAFGYWAWSGSGGSSEAPLIKADTTPNKVVPATQGADTQGNKRIYDRFGDKGAGGERIVQREETPGEIKPPRQVYPSAGGVYGPAPPAAAAPAAAAPAAPAAPPGGAPASGEPRKVHTEVIRPNQVATLEPGQAVAPPPAAAPPPAPPAAAAPPAKQRAKQAPTVLSAQPPAAEAAAEPPPPTRSAAPAGGYVVQLSSQRSEEEARASFQTLQTKYAAVFGDRQPLIKRADLGAKGVVYRAQVGPFPSQDQANQFCSSLKVAGGHCFVQKN